MDDIVNLLKKLSNHVANSIRVCMPAKIETYDFKTQQASVKIDMKELYDNGSTIDYPVVSGVPVVFMSSGGASITMPVNRGDSCLLVYADRDMSNWLLGGTGQKPDSTRMHNLSDAIAIMGLFPFASGPRAENNTDVLINYSGSKIMLKPNGVINIETTKDVNIKAVDNVNISSKHTNINTVEDTIINCKNLTVMSSETITLNSKNNNITTTEDVVINCRNASITSTENITINSKNANVTTSEELVVNCKNMTATVAENMIAKCTTAKITATGNIEIESVDTKLTATGNINATCIDATIIASGNINTTAIKFIHTGDMQISGNLELQGSGSGANGGAIVFTGGITNTGTINNTGNITNMGGTISSNGITLETHTHPYSEAVAGSSPTVVIPGFTGTPL
jgi:hypothetical protein